MIYERNGVNQSSCSPSVVVHNQHILLLSPPIPSPPWVQNGLPKVHSHSPPGSTSVAASNPELKHLQQPSKGPASSLGPVRGRPYTLILGFSASRLEKLFCCSEAFLLVYRHPTLQALESSKCLEEETNHVFEVPPLYSAVSNFVSLSPAEGISLPPAVSSTAPGLKALSQGHKRSQRKSQLALQASPRPRTRLLCLSPLQLLPKDLNG